jgi:hypothetical protein
LIVNKTKCKVLSRRRVDVGALETLSIDNEKLEEVTSIKYLGVQIENKLNFKEHDREKKLQKIGFLRRISQIAALLL